MCRRATASQLHVTNMARARRHFTQGSCGAKTARAFWNSGDSMKRSCKYCGRIHKLGYVCPQKPKLHGEHHDDTIRQFRASGTWTRIRAEILERDGYRCRVCEARHEPRRYNPKRLSVHHIVPLADDMSRAEDAGNLITLCDKHHVQADRGEISKNFLFGLIPPGIELEIFENPI